MKRLDLKKLTPPGRETSRMMRSGGFALFAAVMRSFGFFSEYLDARNLLYTPRRPAGGEAVLIPGAVIAPFSRVLQGAFSLFPLFWLIMGLEVISAYRYHIGESRPMYLMRRLPNRWELHRRCWGLPLMCAGAGMALMGILTALYFLVYLVFTPAECLPF